MKYTFNIASFLVIVLALSSCIEKTNTTKGFDKEIYTPQYASGFSILGSESKQSTLIRVCNPWQGADSVTTELLIVRNNEDVPSGYDGQVLHGNAKKVVTMSSTYVAMFDAIGAIDDVVGVSGIDFISNDKIRANKNKIGDVGYEGHIDYEVLAALSPDIVLLYGVTGASQMESKLKELNIPFIYIGDYLEESPLGKAEWMVALAEIVGKRDAGIEIFSKIPQRYNTVRERVNNVTEKPKVMINTPYSDSWFMPSNQSYIAQLINDAGAEYIYNKNNGNTSMPIDMEEAYLLTSKADKWINVGSMCSLDEMRNTYPKFIDTKPLKSGEIYNSNKRVSQSGANDYWESGIVNPDLVLRDMIKIMHPELVTEDFVYYQQLK